MLLEVKIQTDSLSGEGDAILCIEIEAVLFWMGCIGLS